MVTQRVEIGIYSDSVGDAVLTVTQRGQVGALIVRLWPDQVRSGQSTCTT